MLPMIPKLEVNIRKGPNVINDMVSAGQFMVKNQIPTLVTDPTFLDQMIIERARNQGHYKIITIVDYDNGRKYAIDKIKHLPKSIFAGDGLEFALTPNLSEKESLNEMKALSEFTKSIDQLQEIRWSLGLRSRSTSILNGVMLALKFSPATLVRTDFDVTHINANIMQHNEDIQYIKQFTATPIKVSGNVDYLMTLNLPAIRFDVSLEQAKKIIRDAQTQA